MFLDFEDVDPLNETLELVAGSDDNCIGIVIWEDVVPEDDEQFTVGIYNTSDGQLLASTDVTVLDDDRELVVIQNHSHYYMVCYSQV